jgi:hypothetical protein
VKEESKYEVIEDWLADPLLDTKIKYSYDKEIEKKFGEEFRDLKGFHYSVRLNLDGADFFCRSVIGIFSIPDNFGLYLLADRMKKWYLQAFFNSLISALDTLLQEINVCYNINLPVKEVNYNIFKNNKDKLSKDLIKHYKSNEKSQWYTEICFCRNVSTHHHYLPTTSTSGRSGNNPLDYVEYNAKMLCGIDQNEKPVLKEFMDCRNYLKDTVSFINKAWEIMYKT